jgi:Outer membrane protein
LTTSIGTASAELSGLFGSGSKSWNFAPQIDVPIFDARTWAAYRVSKAQREIVLTQYEKTIQTAFKEVADALAVRGTIGQQVVAQQSLVNAVAETYRLSNQCYTKGIDSYRGKGDVRKEVTRCRPHMSYLLSYGRPHWSFTAFPNSLQPSVYLPE